MSYDPFEGVERLNQLSPEELRMRNDQMLNPVLRFTQDMTDDERNEISRAWYTKLIEGQNSQETYTNSPSGENNTASSELQLPIGWNERSNATCGVNSFVTAEELVRQQRAKEERERLDQLEREKAEKEAAELKQTNNQATSGQMNLLEKAAHDVLAAQKVLSESKKILDTLLTSMKEGGKSEGEIKESLEYKLAEMDVDQAFTAYKHAMNKETMVMQMMMQK